MSLSKKESVWRGRTQACSRLSSNSQLGCSSESLADQNFILKRDSAKKAPLVLMCYCVSCKREFLLQKEAWQYVTGVILISTRFISTRLSLHHTEADHSLLSLKRSAVITVHPSFLGQAVTTAGVGQKRCPFPLLSPHSYDNFITKWPPKIFTKYAKMKFSLPSDA